MATARQCETCGAPLDEPQHYCLVCGSRAGARSPQLDELLRRVRGGSAGRGKDSPAAATAATPTPSPTGPRAQGPLRLPGPRMSVVLVASFIGFGALLGAAGASSGGKLAAATGTPLKLVVPQSDGAAGGAPKGAEAPEASEPPQSEPEATPTPSGEPTSTTTEPSPSTTGRQTPPPSRKAAAAPKLSEIGHVFVIMLSDQPYAADFGPESADHYLARTLEPKGALLVHYDAIAHEQLPNGIALLSGQGPTAATAADCATYLPFSSTGVGTSAQLLGEGCVYPSTVETLPGQLAAHHLRWRAYVQGIDEAGAAAPACAHPAAGAADPTAPGGTYATYRNAPVYFESITASASCATDDVGLSSLKTDLAGPASRTPQLSYIVPDRCHDAGPAPCAAGAPSGPADAAGVLAEAVGEITASQAYRKDGLLVITADEAPSSGEFADSSLCCGQPPYPNYTSPQLNHGGGAVGALLLSPFIKGGASSQEPYNHYSLLRTIEDAFELGHLGYAALPAVKSFSTTLLDAPAPGR